MARQLYSRLMVAAMLVLAAAAGYEMHARAVERAENLAAFPPLTRHEEIALADAEIIQSYDDCTLENSCTWYSNADAPRVWDYLGPFVLPGCESGTCDLSGWERRCDNTPGCADVVLRREYLVSLESGGLDENLFYAANGRFTPPGIDPYATCGIGQTTVSEVDGVTYPIVVGCAPIKPTR